MNKYTKEVSREENIHGYGKYSYLDENSSEILDLLVEFTKNNNYKIYKHKVRYAEENISTEKFYKFRNPNCPPANIPYCDLVCYLDIYCQ